MMDKTVQYGSMKYPESPVNLPANEPVAEFGSDVMADTLSDMGFEHVFILPGSSFRGLHDSLVNHRRNHKPEMIMGNHESIVVAMAHGYAKASGQTGLCIIHDLVGVMCGAVGVFDAWVDRVPLLVLGGSGPEDPGRRRPIDWTHTARSQCDLVKPFTKWTAEPPTLQSVIDSLLRANKIASSSPCGPSYVSVDLGLQEDPIPEDLVLPDATLPRHQPPPPIAASASAVEQAVDMLLAAEMPLIVGGRFGRDVGTSELLAELVELSGAAYVDDRAVVCMPTMHPQNLNGDTRIRKEADLIVAVDCADTVTAADAYTLDLRGRNGQKIIEMTLDNLNPSEWSNVGGPQAAVDLQLDCEPRHGVGQLIEALASRRRSGDHRGPAIDARKQVLAERHAALRRTQKEAWRNAWDDRPICGGRLVHELFEAVREKPWVLAVRNHRSFPEGIWEFTASGQYLGADGGGGVGYGPGAAVGAALAYRTQGRLTVAIMGDGDFQMGNGAVWTAVHYRIPVLIVINNNTSWGNDEFHQINIARRRNRPAENAWIGQRMAEPATDFAALARSYGAWAVGPVEDPGDLADAFRQAVAEVEKGNVAVVDARTAL